MATDQEIRDAGLLYIPKQKYLQNPYNLPIAPVPPPASGGITNTNAFTNSGGNDFNPAGNAFGYGSPVNEVNVRTFNPQSNDPTGSVANAQTMYNKASNAGPMVETFTGMRPSESVMDYYGGQIMDNKEQYGAQGQYNSPYDDTVDLGYLGRDTSTSIQRNRGTLGKAIDFVTDFIPGVGAVKRGAKFIGGLLPDNPNGPGGGTYGVAGLSDAQKEQYNALANQGMLFSGSSGMKTSTGKNFTGKGYEQGQLDIYDKEFADLTDDEKAELADIKNKAFKAKKFRESVVINNFRQDKKDKIAAASAENRGEANAITNRLANEYKAQQQSDGRDFSVSGPDTSSNPTGKSNQASSERGYAMHRADGGRVGYFFGGRVNFKNGGLASIL